MVACFRNLFGGMVDAGVDDFSSLSYLFDLFFCSPTKKSSRFSSRSIIVYLANYWFIVPYTRTAPLNLVGFF